MSMEVRYSCFQIFMSAKWDISTAILLSVCTTAITLGLLIVLHN